MTQLARFQDTIPPVANATERDNLYSNPAKNFRVHNLETDEIQIWTGSAWGVVLQGSGGGGAAYAATIAARNSLTPTTHQWVLVPETGEVYLDDGSGNFTLIIERPSEWLNPKAFGALGDGSGATISSSDVTANAALPTADQWLGTYTAGMTWDYVGLQECMYHAWAGHSSTPGSIVWNGTANSTSNKGMRIPGGSYVLSHALLPVDVEGAHVIGAGRNTTLITIKKQYEQAFRTNGWSRSVMHGIRWQGDSDGSGRSRGFWWPSRSYSVGDRIHSTNTTTAGAGVLPGDCFECTTAGISGASEPTWANTDASHHLTDGTGTLVWTHKPSTPIVLFDYDGSGFGDTMQANTVSQCDAQSTNATTHAVGFQIAVNLSSQGSEFLVENCHTMWTPIGWRTMDADSYAIQILGGNSANNRMHGIHVYRGSIYGRGTGFQNGLAGLLDEDNRQYGHDIFCEGSADTVSRFTAFRSESAKIARVANAHTLVLDGVEHNPGGNVNDYANLGASHVTAAGLMAYSRTSKMDGATWECTTAGTTGASEPDWIGSGGSPITDGTVTWTKRNPFVYDGDGIFATNAQLKYGQVNVESSDWVPSKFHLISSRPDWIHNSVGVFNRLTMLDYNVIVKLGGAFNTGSITPAEYRLAGSSTMPWSRNQRGFGNALATWHNHLGGMGLGLIDHRDIDDADLDDAYRAFLAIVARSGAATGLTVQPPQDDDADGYDFTLAGGASRGNGTPGWFYLASSQVGSSGGQVNPPVKAVGIDPEQRMHVHVPVTAPTDATIVAGRLTIYLDESGNNIKIRVRKSDGTYKTATLAMS